MHMHLLHFKDPPLPFSPVSEMWDLRKHLSNCRPLKQQLMWQFTRLLYVCMSNTDKREHLKGKCDSEELIMKKLIRPDRQVCLDGTLHMT